MANWIISRVQEYELRYLYCCNGINEKCDISDYYLAQCDTCPICKGMPIFRHIKMVDRFNEFVFTLYHQCYINASYAWYGRSQTPSELTNSWNNINSHRIWFIELFTDFTYFLKAILNIPTDHEPMPYFRSNHCLLGYLICVVSLNKILADLP